MQEIDDIMLSGGCQRLVFWRFFGFFVKNGGENEIMGQKRLTCAVYTCYFISLG
jgi:hypothetical protein